MTKHEFENLPMLLTRAQVLRCGISRRQLHDLQTVVLDGVRVPSGMIGAIRLHNHAYSRYVKADVARLCGFGGD